MEIDELPSGKQDRKPDIDMNGIVGTHDILMLCFDTLRYDVSVAEEASGGTPGLNSYGEEACSRQFYLSLAFRHFCRILAFTCRTPCVAQPEVAFFPFSGRHGAHTSGGQLCF